MTEKGFLDKVILNPIPGVWEIELWDNNFVFQPEQIDSKPLAPVPADLAVSLIGFTASPDVFKIPAPGIGDSRPEQVKFSNAFAPIDAKSNSFPLGSEFDATKTISAGEMQVTDLEIPEGTARLEVSIGHPSDPQTDLDLYLYFATKDTLVLRGRSDSSGSNEKVVIDHPEAGKWKFVVDGFRVPGGSVQYKYRDIYFHPAFGLVSIDDKDAMRNRNDSWDVSAKVEVRADPVGERKLTGIAPVVAAAKTGDVAPSRPDNILVVVGGAPTTAMVVIGESRIQVQQ